MVSAEQAWSWLLNGLGGLTALLRQQLEEGPSPEPWQLQRLQDLCSELLDLTPSSPVHPTAAPPRPAPPSSEEHPLA